MSILEFLEKNKIQFQPLRLLKKTPQYCDLYGAMPKQTDFTTHRLTDEEFKRRKTFSKKLPHLVIDTSIYLHIDIDFTEDKFDSYSQESKDFVADMCSKFPYFKSVSKPHGKHIIIKTTTEFSSVRPQSIFDDIEFLVGQWSYADIKQDIINPDIEIKTIDITHFVKPECLKQETSDKKTFQYKVKKSNKIIEDTSQPLEMDENCSDEKHKIFELMHLLPIKYSDEHSSWTKIVWSLGNYKSDIGETLEDIALEFSKKSEKFDIVSFNKLWCQIHNGNTISTFYYYCKEADPKKFKSICAKYFLKDGGDLDFLTTDEYLAQYFIDSNLNNLVALTSDKKVDLFIYENKLWRPDTSQGHRISNLIQTECSNYIGALQIETTYKIYDTENPPSNKEKQQLFETQKILLKLADKLRNVKKIGDVKTRVIQKLASMDFSHVEFDSNGYLFAFNNKVFDLRTFAETETSREDYILTTCGYNHEDATDEQLEELDTLINKIIPDPEIKAYYFQVLATCCYGVPIEKFIIANGSGGNGKGLVNELMAACLGNYFYKANNDILLNPLKQGNNPQVANMHNKRMIVYAEPESEGTKLNGSTIKELTGGEEINARMNYSNITKTLLKATHILECNKKPKIDGRIDDSYVRRLADVPFLQSFTDNTETLNEGLDGVHEANTYYKSSEFKSEFKHVLFKYLLNFMKIYKQNNNALVVDKLTSPKAISDRTSAYLESSDEIKEWFNTLYQKIIHTEESTNKTKIENEEYVKVHDVYIEFKNSDYFHNLSKKVKREYNEKYFMDYMESNINFRRYYVQCYQVNGTRYRNILWSHKAKVQIDED
tara:strand:+ start:126 stop:2612 length:2487 start_codon:yes stop_codon:yes gene_type:complete